MFSMFYSLLNLHMGGIYQITQCEDCQKAFLMGVLPDMMVPDAVNHLKK